MTARVLTDVGPALASALANSTGRSWYHGEPPADAAAPFGLVHLLPGNTATTLQRFPSALPSAFQITAVGKTPEDAGWLLDKARTFFDGVTLPMSCSAVTQINSVYGSGGPPTAPIREGSLMSMTEDYRILIGGV